tara:strand:- start:11991 stop:12917 length:927 start_codon:yes stop_codon:yes gene_type:complete
MISTSKELIHVYRKKVTPYLKDFHQSRGTIHLYLFVCLIIGAGALYSYFRGYSFFSVILLGGASFFFTMKWRSYRNRFKKRIIKRVMHELYPEFKFKIKGDLSLNKFRETKLFMSSINRYHCEDQLEGVVGQTNFKLSEVHAKYKSSGKNSSTRTVFKGFVLEVDFHKNFIGHTVVLNDIPVKVFGKWLGEKINDISFGKLKKVKLENVEFEDRFVVHATDAQEARYILSPKLMERILKMSHRKQEVRLSFYENKLFISLANRKNFYEPQLFGDIFPMKDLWAINRVICSVPEIIETLDLNTRIWTKK